MTDAFGRRIDYLRLSVTELCNLRCAYCMPPEGVCKRRHEEICSLEELEELAAAFVELGVRKIRLTGGEPLVRRGIVNLTERLAALKSAGLEELTMTTNGLLLPELAAPLRAAGLDRLNISLDSLRPERYRTLTRGGELDRVLAGIAAAEAAGFRRLRLNAVLLKGVNEDELAELARLARDHPWDVRFIELMPIGPAAALPFLPAARVLEAVPELRETQNEASGIRHQASEPPAGSGAQCAPQLPRFDEASGIRHQASGDGGREAMGEPAVGTSIACPSSPAPAMPQDEASGIRHQASWDVGRGFFAPLSMTGLGAGSAVGSVARYYSAPGWAGRVGLIAPMTACFCEACSRVRLTADGKLKPCLHSAEEYPLRGLHGEALRAAILAAVRQKPARHSLSPAHPSDSARPMDQIGG